MWFPEDGPLPDRLPNNKRSMSARELVLQGFSHALTPFTLREFICYQDSLSKSFSFGEYIQTEMKTDKYIATDAYNFWMEVMPFAVHAGSKKDGVQMPPFEEMIRRVSVHALREEIFGFACEPNQTVTNPIERYWDKAGYALAELGRMVANGADVLRMPDGKNEKTPSIVEEAKENFGQSLGRPYATAFGGILGQVWAGLLTSEVRFSRLGFFPGARRQTGLGGTLVVTDKKILRALTEMVRDNPYVADAFFASYIMITQQKYIDQFRKKVSAISEKIDSYLEFVIKPSNEIVQRHGIRLLQEYLKTRDVPPLLLSKIRKKGDPYFPDVVATRGENGFVYLSGNMRIPGVDHPIGFKIGVKNGQWSGFEYLPGAYNIPDKKKFKEIEAAVKEVGYAFVKSIGICDAAGYRREINKVGHKAAYKQMKDFEAHLFGLKSVSAFFGEQEYEVTVL